MDPTLTSQFLHYLGLAKTRIASHVERKDETSMRLAAYACGRVVGFYVAHNHPMEWTDAVQDLQNECFDKIGMC